MAKQTDEVLFTQHQKVVAGRDLPGIAAGTPGKIMLINGLTWVRYRVVFEGRIERGMLNADDLMTVDAWAARERGRLADERSAELEAKRIARQAELANGSAA
ncbi:MAG: hypothetical protein WCK41_02615 [Actinomycetes bacterium]